jgi:hypothetical protein
MTRYAWFNLFTKTFTETWSYETEFQIRRETPDARLPERLRAARRKGMVLIEYRPINDQEFQFKLDTPLK